MKCLFVLLLIIAIILSGCAGSRTDITREEIIAAYEDAGFDVWSGVYDEPLDYGQVAYVQANHPDGDYIYFSIFETEAQAKTYKKEYHHPVMMGLFSVIYGDPSWQRWEVHGNIVVQYDKPEFYDVFHELLKGK